MTCGHAIPIAALRAVKPYGIAALTSSDACIRL